MFARLSTERVAAEEVHFSGEILPVLDDGNVGDVSDLHLPGRIGGGLI